MSDVYLWETYDKLGREALECQDYPQAISAFKAAVTLAEELPGEVRKLIVSLINLSLATSKSGQLSLAYDIAQKTRELADTRLGSSAKETVSVLRVLYQMARELGFLEQAEGYLVEVVDALRADDPTEDFLNTLDLLARLADEQEHWDKAKLIYEELIDAHATLYDLPQPSLAPLLLRYALTLSRSGWSSLADEPLERAFSMLESLFADDPQSLARSLLAGADLLNGGAQHVAALKHQKRALNLLVSTLPENDPLIWDTRELIASTLAALGKIPEAIELLEYCRPYRDANPSHLTAGLLKNLAGLYLANGQVDYARELYPLARKQLEKTLGPDHIATLAAVEEETQLHFMEGRFQHALDLALTTIRATENRYGSGHPSTAQVYASTARLAYAAKRWDTAYELMKAAEAIWETLSPKPQDVLANCRWNLATCLVELGRYNEALNLLDELEAFPLYSNPTLAQELRQRASQSSKDQSEPQSCPENPLAAHPTENLLPNPERIGPAAFNYDPTQPDRRQHVRSHLGINQFFNLQFQGEGLPPLAARSFLVDLSLGGLRVNSEQALPLDKALTLTFPAQVLGEELTVSGRIVWERALFDTSFILGIEFSDLGSKANQLIANLLTTDLARGQGRQHFRLYRPFPIEVTPNSSLDGTSSYASDLSLDGVGTRLERQLPTGTPVRLRLGLDFELPPVEVQATVAWSERADNGVAHGLHFQEMGPIEARTLKAFMDRCLELSPE